NTIHGLSNGEIAKALDESPVNISRALDVLVDEGFSTKLDSGRYALGLQVAKIGYAHINELDRAEQRIKELRQRTVAGALN
ncbi:IclR family transcriptional regulator, partial [Pseudodesulfovibrio sp. JC047]|uniref:IclR family transcriptional regulator n=1 Tax=Pseudodesulfovibrio sp. JC047 TaxID=2683199 RepID=UPI0013CF51ED